MVQIRRIQTNNKYYCAFINLIYKNTLISQFHIESDFITLDDIKKNNNFNMVIIKKHVIGCESDDDVNDNYTSENDDNE